MLAFFSVFHVGRGSIKWGGDVRCRGWWDGDDGITSGDGFAEVVLEGVSGFCGREGCTVVLGWWCLTGFDPGINTRVGFCLLGHKGVGWVCWYLDWIW